MGIKRFGNKLVGKIKTFGNKHKGKIAVIGAIAGAGAKAHYDSGEEERVKDKAAKRAEELMNTEEDKYQAEQERKAKEAHDKLMAGAKPQPKGKGNIGKPAQDPNLIQVGLNVPRALQKAGKASKEVEEAGLLKKGKKLEKGVVGVLDELNAPSKKEQKRVSEEQRFLQGEMSDAEAQAYINKKGGRKAKGKSKKAAKQVEQRKKKKKKAKEKEWRKDPKYKKGAGKKGGYDF